MTARELTYKKLLYQFMSFLDGIEYSPTDDAIHFSTERLASISADDVAGYINFLAYGTKHPAENTDDRPPPSRRASTLFRYKLAISYFMPCRTMQWDALAKRGDPTKSTAVNKVIKQVKKYEIRHDWHYVPRNRREYSVVKAASAALSSRNGTLSLQALGGRSRQRCSQKSPRGTTTMAR